jgi:hypothetical protein
MSQPLPVADPVVMPLARELLACLDLEISKVASPPQYVQLRPGTIVDHLMSTSDDECCAGLAWVRPAGFVPSSGTFPAQDEVPIKGGVRAWAITLEMGAIRCAPTPGPSAIPTGDEWDATVQAVMDDAAAMRRAICCFIDAAPGRSARVLAGLWQPISVQGGCTGGTLPVTIMGPACDCSEAGPIS